MTHDLRSKPMTTALEIAVLCQALPIQAAADLIEQYARTVASGAALDAAQRMSDRINIAMEAPVKTVVFP